MDVHHQDRFITEQSAHHPPSPPNPLPPESTAPEEQISYVRCLGERRGLRRRTPHCVRETSPGVLHISDALKRSPVQRPPISHQQLILLFMCPHWHLEPWQSLPNPTVLSPAAHPPLYVSSLAS
ncbi:unnamed protein product [Penicillium roqueforti FM164]|uniref:Genomic scaffold, ProqFM164S02 n=1 Tax=Penicillium roqueforti (strain FM164) TaxID=1365484 RepID=W6Q6X4_PENRF|nr:unnamed protein product [Penicillium roqueforti FM164]